MMLMVDLTELQYQALTRLADEVGLYPLDVLYLVLEAGWPEVERAFRPHTTPAPPDTRSLRRPKSWLRLVK